MHSPGIAFGLINFLPAHAGSSSTGGSFTSSSGSRGIAECYSNVDSTFPISKLVTHSPRPRPCPPFIFLINFDFQFFFSDLKCVAGGKELSDASTYRVDSRARWFMHFGCYAFMLFTGPSRTRIEITRVRTVRYLAPLHNLRNGIIHVAHRTGRAEYVMTHSSAEHHVSRIPRSSSALHLLHFLKVKRAQSSTI